MKVRVKRTKIHKEKCNQVLSHLIMEPHRRQKVDSLSFHEDGIFSKRIFGNLYRCDCGQQREEGWCPSCGVRVINPEHMPDFYIDLCCRVPVAYVKWDGAHRKEDGKWDYSIKLKTNQIESLANYLSFLYVKDDKMQFVEVNDDINPDDWSEGQIYIGADALIKAGVKQEWVDEHMVDFLSIPHTVFRPMVISNSNPFITDINKLYSNIILKINNVKSIEQSMSKSRPLYLLAAYKAINELYVGIIKQLLIELQDAEFSILKSEIIGHPISGAVRATLINRHDVHEDVIIIGDTLVETLFPYLYKKFEGDMERINKELVDAGTLILVNRPPTINHASILAMYPRIASIYPVGHTEGTNYCMLHNEKWCEERKLKEMEKGHVNYGDVERCGQGLEIDPNTGEEDGIDTLGLRCVGANPIMMDTMNADCDGDVLLEIALYSLAAINEAKGITPSRSFLNYANGTIRNHIIEDFIFALDDEEEDDKEKE